MTIDQAVTYYTHAQGITQHALAERLGIHPVTLSNAKKHGRAGRTVLSALVREGVLTEADAGRAMVGW